MELFVAFPSTSTLYNSRRCFGEFPNKGASSDTTSCFGADEMCTVGDTKSTAGFMCVFMVRSVVYATIRYLDVPFATSSGNE